MIGLDTNVLIRYLVQDDPDQSRQASEFIEANCSDENTGFNEIRTNYWEKYKKEGRIFFSGIYQKKL